MKKFIGILAIAGCLVLGASGVLLAATTVVESVTGSPGDWTYAYTLTNGETRDIWYWCVWFPSDPHASPRSGTDTVTADTPNWNGTNLSTHGYFPQEYTNAWSCHVYDSASNDLVGPNGEPGFYYTVAEDFTSGNPGQYWDGDSWELLPDPGDAVWRGEDYGWNGSGANMQTIYGVAVSGTGQFTVHSSAQAAVTGEKSFSFCTTDYWYSFYDTADNLDFEGFGTVIPEPATLSLLALGGLALLRRRRGYGG